MDQAQIQMTKAVLWEEAKGKMRALCHVEGHRRLTEPMTAGMEKSYTARWTELEAVVEKFIEDFENDGYQE